MEAYIKDLFDTLYLNESKLTPGQTDFVDSVKKQFKKSKSVSDKQIEVLRDIKKSLQFNKSEQRYTMQINN